MASLNNCAFIGNVGKIETRYRDWCDLFFYNENLPCLTIRQHRNETIIHALFDQIQNVIVERDRVLKEIQEFN